MNLEPYLAHNTQSNLKCSATKSQHTRPETAFLRKSAYELALTNTWDFEFVGYSRPHSLTNKGGLHANNMLWAKHYSFCESGILVYAGQLMPT